MNYRACCLLVVSSQSACFALAIFDSTRIDSHRFKSSSVEARRPLASRCSSCHSRVRHRYIYMSHSLYMFPHSFIRMNITILVVVVVVVVILLLLVSVTLFCICVVVDNANKTTKLILLVEHSFAGAVKQQQQQQQQQQQHELPQPQQAVVAAATAASVVAKTGRTAATSAAVNTSDQIVDRLKISACACMRTFALVDTIATIQFFTTAAGTHNNTHNNYVF